MWLFKTLLLPVRRFLEKRRFPTLLLIMGGLFLLNLFIPDPIPLIDDLILLTLTVIIGSVRRTPDPGAGKKD